MKILTAILLASIVYAATPDTSFAGNCNYSWQTAKDGSSCGDRAANKRYGGN